MRRLRTPLLIVVVGLLSVAAFDPLHLLHDSVDHRVHGTKDDRTGMRSLAVPTERMSDVPCVDGMAGPFPCDDVDLLGFVPLDEFRGVDAQAPLGGGLSDLWGWTDPDNADEYVIVGKTNGTAFFRVTDPTDAEYLGEIPNTAAAQLIWHDIKVHDDHAFIVSESQPHGMEVFDLTRLRGVTEPQTWTPDSIYPLSFAAHNIAINEDTATAFIVGGNEGLAAPDQCASGLHMVDISIPVAPLFAGCFMDGGGPGVAGGITGGPLAQVSSYVHDTQCVVYDGPDVRYEGREICFNSSESHFAVVDVTDRLDPVEIGRLAYPNVSYAHQGWLTEDRRFFLMGDEGDERKHRTNTRTIVLDVTDLENPALHIEKLHDTTSIDHNMYVLDHFVYQSNYTSGLQVLNAEPLEGGQLPTIASFDTYPGDDRAIFAGTWSNYPYFESGTIAVTGTDEGLFLLRLHDDAADDDQDETQP